MHIHSQNYDEYMHSKRWARRKRLLYSKRGYVCEMCGASGVQLDVHHKNYDRLGRELDDDLMIVCHEYCHSKADRERVKWEARRKHQREHPPKWATLEEIEILTMRIVSTK